MIDKVPFGVQIHLDRKARITLAVAVVLAAVLLYFSFRGIDMAELGGTPIPNYLRERFSRVAEDPDAVRTLGIEIATQLSRELLDAGAPGLHFYTMNSSTATQEIYSQLGIPGRA